MPTALVTGASAGLGTHFALALAQRGHHLVLVARRGDLLDQLAELLTRRHNVSAHVIVADLAKKNAVARLAAELEARALTIAILVDRKSTRLNFSYYCASRLPSSALNK